MTDDLRAAIASLVAAAVRPTVDPASIEDATVLLEGGLDLDSLALLEIVVGLEGLGVAVAEGDVAPERFGTFGRLVAFARDRRGGAGAR